MNTTNTPIQWSLIIQKYLKKINETDEYVNKGYVF